MAKTVSVVYKVILQGTMLHIPTKQMLHSVVYIDIIKRKATESQYAKMCLQQKKSNYNYKKKLGSQVHHPDYYIRALKQGNSLPQNITIIGK